MAIVGYDGGYALGKTSELKMFPSRMTKVEPVLGCKSKITIGSNSYYVGIGPGTVDLNKVNHDLTRVCLLYGISISTTDEAVYVVTGLPIGQYKAQRNELRDAVMTLPPFFYVNDNARTLKIRDCIIYPQGIAAVYGIQEDVIVCDVGGRTVDIGFARYVNGKIELVYSNTLFEGVIQLYTKIASTVNQRFNLSLPADYAQNILYKGLCIDGEQQDTSFLKPLLAEHIQPIVDDIQLNTPFKTTKIMLCGGGAILLERAFRNRFPKVGMVDNAQFANAIGFRKVGERHWH